MLYLRQSRSCFHRTTAIFFNRVVAGKIQARPQALFYYWRQIHNRLLHHRYLISDVDSGA